MKSYITSLESVQKWTQVDPMLGGQTVYVMGDPNVELNPTILEHCKAKRTNMVRVPWPADPAEKAFLQGYIFGCTEGKKLNLFEYDQNSVFSQYGKYIVGLGYAKRPLPTNMIDGVPVVNTKAPIVKAPQYEYTFDNMPDNVKKVFKELKLAEYAAKNNDSIDRIATAFVRSVKFSYEDVTFQVQLNANMKDDKITEMLYKKFCRQYDKLKAVFAKA